MPQAKCTFVYVVEGSGECKIGVTFDVRQRFRTLRRDGALGLVGCWHRPEDAFQIERRAHSMLRKGRARGGKRSEWFRVTKEEAIAAVVDAMKASGTVTDMEVVRVGFDWLAYQEELAALTAQFEAWIATPEGAVEFEKLRKR